MTFAVLDAADAEDRQRWLDAYHRWPSREPFAHPAFVERFVSGVQRAVCAIREDPDGTILMPLVIRPIDDGGIDATTPYGYGGPFAYGQFETEEFWRDLESWAQDQGLVSLVARLSLFPDNLAPFAGETREVMQNVVRSLDLDDEALWMDYEHKVRKNVKKALRSEITVEVERTGARLAEFHDIYISTMNRREAADGFHFSRDFFAQLIAECPDEVAFFHALLDGKVVSTELVLIGADATYSFLGGTDQRFFELRPNDLLKHEIIRWSRGEGKSYFVLGGGYGQEDGIFKYKRSFAPNDGVRPFRIGAKVFDGARYEALIERRKIAEPDWQPQPGFFPAYRAPGLRID